MPEDSTHKHTEQAKPGDRYRVWSSLDPDSSSCGALGDRPS